MSKPKSYIGIKNSAESKTLELHFTDFIYDGFDWNTWETKNLVQETIDKIKDANPDTIKVLINSLGGDVMIGLALYNYIKAHKATVEVEVLGFAASIASVMAMAADPGKMKMAKSSFLIIHQAWSYAMGNAVELRQQAENLETISNQLAEVYALRSGKAASHFTGMWQDGDVWLTADEAKAEGLCDEIFNGAEVVAHASLEEFGFRNIPERFKPAASATPPPQNEAHGFFQTLKTDLMSIVNSMKAAFSGAKTAEANKDIPNRDAILDMVQAALEPVLTEFDTVVENLTKPPKAETETPPAPAEAAPAPAQEAPKGEDIKKLEQELEAVKARLAAASMKPEAETPSPKAATRALWTVEV